MDIATVAGIVSAFALVFTAILLGGGIGMFIDAQSLMIVIGGTMGATMINYPLKDVLAVFKIVKNVFFSSIPTSGELIEKFIDFANKSRREGVLVLEGELNNINDPFLAKGLQLTIDGMEPESIKEILETEIDFIRDRHQFGAEIFNTMGSFAPALGMIGTLIGLVQMLKSMNDPSTIGPAMAVALLTTFYGAILANLLFVPMAGKLKTRSKEEVLVKEMIVNGIIAISVGENPRIVEQKLHAFLAPNLRKSQFE